MLFDGIYSASFLVATRKKATPTITIFILLPLHMIATPGHLKCSAAAARGPCPGPGTTATTSVTPHALAPIAQLRRRPRLRVGTVTSESEPQSLEIQTA